MPIGSYSIAFQIVDELWRKKPATVLDLGVGTGLYGPMLRQWLDNGMPPYRTRLYGVEAWESYRSACWQYYDKVFRCRIEDFLDSGPDLYDAVVFSDVIEHFTKEDGAAVVEKIKTILNPSGVLLIGTPAVFIEQGAAYGNVFETHRSLWTEQDFTALGCQILRDGNPCQYGHSMLLAKFEK